MDNGHSRGSEKKKNGLKPIQQVDECCQQMLLTHNEYLRELAVLMKRAGQLERENASLEHKVIDQEKQFGTRDRQNDLTEKSIGYLESANEVRHAENQELASANDQLANQVAKQRHQLQAVNKKLQQCDFERKILLEKRNKAWSKPREDAGAGRQKGRLEDQRVILEKSKYIAFLKSEIDEYKKRSTKVRVDLKKKQK